MQKALLLFYALLTVAAQGDCAKLYPPLRRAVRDPPVNYNTTRDAASIGPTTTTSPSFLLGSTSSSYPSTITSTSSTVSSWNTSSSDISSYIRSATSPSHVPASSSKPPQTLRSSQTPTSTTVRPVVTYPPYPVSNSTTTLPVGACSGSVTYYDSVPPTVYLTVTEAFTVTVTASNASLPPVQIITPPPACSSTILPLAASFQPLVALSSSSDTTWPSISTTKDPLPGASTTLPDPMASAKPGAPIATPAVVGGPASVTTTLAFPPDPAQITNAGTKASSLAGAPLTKSPSYVPEVNTVAPQPSTGSAYTSTVLVTKKTPVPIVVPPTSPPPNFQTTTPATGPTQGPPPAYPTSDGGQPGNANTGGASTGAGGSTLNFGGGGGNDGPGNTNPGGLVNTSPTTTRLVNVIASIISAQSNPITQAPAAPASTNIDNVPVVILPSSVVVGGQLVSIPGAGSSPTTVLVNGATFAIGPSQIVAPGTTFAIQPPVLQQISATYVPAPTVITAAGLTLTVGANNAVVSGTTYAIGAGAPATTVVVGGQTLSIGTQGVALPSTTVSPEQIETIAPTVVTAGGLTFTVGPSLAVISGTTYSIGPGAASTRVVVGTQTISIGSNGIGLTSTTVAAEKTTAAPSFSLVTVNGLTLSVDATEAVLGGTTYAIGLGAPTETTVVNGKTISIGPSGIGLTKTTIRPVTSSPTGSSTGTKVPGSAGITSFNSTTAVILGGLVAVGAAVVLLI